MEDRRDNRRCTPFLWGLHHNGPQEPRGRDCSPKSDEEGDAIPGPGRRPGKVPRAALPVHFRRDNTGKWEGWQAERPVPRVAGDSEEEAQGLKNWSKNLEVKSGNFSNMLLLKVMTYMSVSPNECKGQGHLFWNPIGGKNFGFPWKILQPANLKGGQKVRKKKEPKRFEPSKWSLLVAMWKLWGACDVCEYER
jgi:hypothetical protein